MHNVKMILDDFDIKILKMSWSIKKGKDIKIWELMIKEFPKVIDYNERNRLYNKIKRRIKRLNGLFRMEKTNGKWVYVLDENNIKFSKHKFFNGYKDSLMVKSGDKWIIFEL